MNIYTKAASQIRESLAALAVAATIEIDDIRIRSDSVEFSFRAAMADGSWMVGKNVRLTL